MKKMWNFLHNAICISKRTVENIFTNVINKTGLFQIYDKASLQIIAFRMYLTYTYKVHVCVNDVNLVVLSLIIHVTVGGMDCLLVIFECFF